MAPHGKPAKIAITILADDKGNKERIMAVSRGARRLSVSPNGKEVAFLYRGDVFVAGADGGGTKRITSTPEIETDAEFSPDGKEIAFIENRNTLRVYNIASKQTRTLLMEKELFGNSHGYRWSPDGKWVLLDYDVSGIAPGEVGLVRADGTGSVVNLTQSGFNDGRGEWIMGGKAMLWFSNRDGLREHGVGQGQEGNIPSRRWCDFQNRYRKR